MGRFKRCIGFALFKVLDPIVSVYHNYLVHSQVKGISFKKANYQIKGPLIVHGADSIRIGMNFSAGIHFRIQSLNSYAGDTFSPRIVIGDNVTIQDYCHIGCVDSIEIGDGTLIGSSVLIIDHNHGCILSSESATLPVMRSLSHNPIKIGKNVWIGDGVKILPGVDIGDGVIVGANSVITHSFPAGVVIAGIPAKIIRYL